MSINFANIIAKPKEIPTLKTSNIGLVLFSAVFIAADVLLPWAAHQFGIAGQVFLPMHFLVLVSALLFGWRMGLVVGLFTPIMSYLFSGMPLFSILPLVIIEVASLGFFAGLFRERFKLNIYLSLILALITAKILLLLAVLVFGGPVAPIDHVLNVIKLSWLGILIQLAFVPLIVKLLYGRIGK
jgi:hypothetical protein